MNRRSLLRGAAVGGAGLAGAALIGCGSGGGDSSGGGASGGSSPAAGTSGGGAAAGQKPNVSEAFVMGQTRDAVSLEPLDAQVYTVPERIGLVYPRLLNPLRNNLDGVTPEAQADTKWVPSYAVDSFEAADGGATVTFKIRKGVKYQNIAPLNGREFTSEDVKYAINRYMTNTKSTFKGRFADIKSIETPDKYTAVFKLNGPSAYFFWAVAAESSLIHPMELGEKDGAMKTNAVGPGPFIHEEYLQKEGSNLKKNPDFIDADRVYYNKFLFKVITDAATRNAGLKTGQIDFVQARLSPSAAKTVEGANATLYPYPVTGVGNLNWNLRNPKWKDIRARRAMSKAIDRDALIANTMQGAGVWSGIVPVGFGKWALTSEEVKKTDSFAYDPKEAAKLWDAAGKPSPNVEFYFSPNGNLGGVQAEFYQKAWKENLGINVNVKTEDYSIFLPSSYNNKYEDMCTVGYFLPFWMENLFAPYVKGGTRNGSGIDDPKVTEMMNDLRATLDEKEAVEKSRKIQNYLADEVLAMAPVPYATGFGSFNSKLRDFHPGVYPPGAEWIVHSWKTK
ncbi:MAG: ABC transporter substrate-binding protein [Dehalococcoidia bacterium]